MKPCGSACFLLFAVVCAATWNTASGRKTVGGKKCAPDHPCGTHGENYYWCYEDRYGARSSDWDYCCRPSYPCGTHGYSYYWCRYGYYNHEWSYCHSEVSATSRRTKSGKYCSPGHSCGQHGYSYNWCYVTGSWDYC